MTRSSLGIVSAAPMLSLFSSAGNRGQSAGWNALVFASRDVLTGFGVTMSFHRVLLRRAFKTLKNTGLGLAYGLWTTFAMPSVLLVLRFVGETKGVELEADARMSTRFDDAQGAVGS